MNDITELAELNRQIAERDQIIRALLPHVDHLKLLQMDRGKCVFCHSPLVRSKSHPAIWEGNHTESCEYKLAIDISS